MKTPVGNLVCGNDPEELFNTLKTGSSVFIIPCGKCDKTLVSIDNEVVSGEDSQVIAYFKCTCGKKYK